MRFATVAVVVFGLVASGAPAAEGDLTVMTYNIRFASPKPPNAWPDRKGALIEVIRNYMPDVLGTQECTFGQAKDIQDGLAEYRWIGLGRDGGSRGEFMAVFYQHEKLEPLEFDHYWLSDTPDVIGSSTWGNTNRRMVTWVRFRDRKAGNQFYFINTHFDHQIQPAREKSAQLILQRIKALDKDVPIILVGDFNSVAGKNPAYDTLVNPDAFKDVWKETEDANREEVSTFNGFGPPRTEGARIDWILYKGSLTPVSAQTHHTGSVPPPSDHFPVIATFNWKPAAGT